MGLMPARASPSRTLVSVAFGGRTRDGHTMPRIGVLKALHRNVVREFKSDRKETHWGKRKLKRDE